MYTGEYILVCKNLWLNVISKSLQSGKVQLSVYDFAWGPGAFLKPVGAPRSLIKDAQTDSLYGLSVVLCEWVVAGG